MVGMMDLMKAGDWPCQTFFLGLCDSIVLGMVDGIQECNEDGLFDGALLGVDDGLDEGNEVVGVEDKASMMADLMDQLIAPRLVLMKEYLIEYHSVLMMESMTGHHLR